jgi:hypothetical protein|tara:strand:+ start:336 stop:1091 length:756 start_codon:yes stop_codon:yes gene_type:complete
MKRLLLTALSVTALSGLATAQENDPPKHLRFIALGELPVWEEEFREGVRVQKDSAPGALPPSSLTYISRGNVKNLRLSLRTVSELVTFPASSEAMVLKTGGVAGKEWIKSRMPASTLSLGVLFRDNANMTWEKPKMLMLRDDADAFPVGRMRFVNVSDSVVIVQMAGTKAFGLSPGKTALKPVKVGLTAIKVGYKTADGGSKAIWQNNVKVRRGERVQCFFYKAQGKKPREAVKFTTMPETLPSLPRAPRR